eukprot:2894210-Pyramimonas_sp.AAC.1
MSEVYNRMYPTSSHLKLKGALVKYQIITRVPRELSPETTWAMLDKHRRALNTSSCYGFACANNGKVRNFDRSVRVARACMTCQAAMVSNIFNAETFPAVSRCHEALAMLETVAFGSSSSNGAARQIMHARSLDRSIAISLRGPLPRVRGLQTPARCGIGAGTAPSCGCLSTSAQVTPAGLTQRRTPPPPPPASTIPTMRVPSRCASAHLLRRVSSEIQFAGSNRKIVSTYETRKQTLACYD